MRPAGAWSRIAAYAAVTAALCVASRAQAATPPAGFAEAVLVSGGQVSVPTAIAYEPGSGALFVLEKGAGVVSGPARVLRRDPASGVLTTALTLSCVDSSGERGLLGIAFDPSYLDAGGANRYVYLYYTRDVSDVGGPCPVSGFPQGEYNWVERYQESAGTLAGAQRIFSGPRTLATNHQGGTLRFASDATLLISMGDDDSDAAPFPHARNLDDLRGKILRINRDGSVPSNNPFVGQPGKRPEIWAWGLRNPFRFSVDSATDTVWIGDVGEARWEEINRGIPGADFGWPCFEANETFRACVPAPPPGTVTSPTYAYGSSGQTYPVEGSSITMGPVYRASAFPAEYQGELFFGDYSSDWVRRARVATDGSLTDITLFLPDATDVVDMAVSPQGCLTWVSIGGQGVRDVCYTGGSNTQPQAQSTAVPTSGLAPLTVNFDGRGSTDADRDLLSYSWDFGDGTTSSAAAPVATYPVNGVRLAVLTVNDGTAAPNGTDSAPPLRIVVGNRSPVGAISGPPPGAHYTAGETIAFAGTATDPEDGALPASGLSWTVVFHHGSHTHPFLGPLSGLTSGSFVVPNTGEEATDVFYRIALTATDSGAPLGAMGTLTQKSSTDILPNLTTVTVAASPPGAGLQLAIDQIPAEAPWSKPTVAGFLRTLTAPSPQSIRGATWSFSSWSDGGLTQHTVAPPVSATTWTATYQCVSGCAFTPVLMVARVAPDTTHLQWSPLACALSYDVVRGNLTTLRSTGGNYALATAACLADDTTLTSLDDPKPTTPSGLWFLVRGNGCGGGSYDDGATPSLPQSRDAEIAASGAACP